MQTGADLSNSAQEEEPSEMPNVTPDTLTGFVQDIFLAAGVRDDIAARVAESLVLSNLQGHDSHGIVRVNLYLNQIKEGHLHPAADPTPVEESPAVVILDAQRSFGQWSAFVLMQKVMEKADAQGVASGGLINSGHVGRLGEWVTLAADAGFIGLAFCNGGGRPGTVAPFGGSERVLGTNPLAAGIPVEGRTPIVIDFATSTVAEGKVKIAFNKQVDLPPGSLLDKHGNPSVNPADLYDGGVMLPAAGHKGFGLGLLNDLLAGVLTGSGAPLKEPGPTWANGVLFIVLKIEAFRALSAFFGDANEYVDFVKSVRPAPGFSEVMVPGEPEGRVAAERKESGIPVDDVTWEALSQAAATYGVAAPVI